MVYCPSNSGMFQCIKHLKATDTTDNFLFPSLLQRLTASRLNFVLQLLCFCFTLCLISTPLLFFFGYIAPKQKNKSSCKPGNKETRFYHFLYTLRAGKAEVPCIFLRFPEHPARTEAIRLATSVNFQALPSTQLHKRQTVPRAAKLMNLLVWQICVQHPQYPPGLHYLHVTSSWQQDSQKSFQFLSTCLLSKFLSMSFRPSTKA